MINCEQATLIEQHKQTEHLLLYAPPIIVLCIGTENMKELNEEVEELKLSKKRSNKENNTVSCFKGIID